MGKKIAILQSNYIPWKGYFDLINSVDEFVLFDTMQYTRRDWRNRNRIKTANGSIWLTIPVEVKGKYYQAIDETIINDTSWAEKHWKSFVYNYSKAPYFSEYRAVFEKIYLENASIYLSEINYCFICAICTLLGIQTRITWAKDYSLVDGKTERLVALCQQVGATEYLSGPAAKNYIDSGLFREADITLSYMDYSGYPEYPQLYPPFEHGVSILDLLFQTGPDAQRYMKSFNA